MDIATLFQKAMEDLQACRPDQALACLQKASELQPQLAAIHYNIGVIYFDQGNFDDASIAYQQAHECAPEDPDILFNLAITFKKKGKILDAANHYEKLLSFSPGDIDASYNLGIIYKEMGDNEKAATCFKKIISQDASHIPAYNHLAHLYHKAGDLEKATPCYQQIVKLDPSHSGARHMLSSLQGKTTDAAPSEYVKEVFDHFADYDQSMEGNLNYATPKYLRNVLQESLEAEKNFKNGLDIGCGTGLSGDAFKDIVETFTGVDLSPVMLAKANKKSIYSALYEMELTSFLEMSTEKYDFFIAADVFVYLGNLKPLFRQTKKHAAIDAVFLFSTETTEKDFTLQATGRYAHSERYIRELAEETGFSVQSCISANIRKEKGEWIRGNLFLLTNKN
jgi:predicted TPR repeat methyltransferase